MFEARDIAVATSERQDIDSENVPDGMEGEQTWPTEEELLAAEQQKKHTIVKKVQDKLYHAFSKHIN